MAPSGWTPFLRGKARRSFNTVAVVFAMSVLPGPSTRDAAADESRGDAALVDAQAQGRIVVPPEAPVIPLPPAPSIEEIVGSDAEKERNVFFSRNRQSIREFRALRGDAETTGPLTPGERSLIDGILQAAREDAKTWRLPVKVAATLRFASGQAGVDHDAYMTRLTQTGGIVAGGDRSGLQRTALFKFNVPIWLYIMQRHGAAHGFGFFAERIRVRETSYGTLVSVNDPNVLRQIVSLRHNPRVSAIMGAEYLRHADEMPARFGYDGADYRPNQQVATDQAHLMTLGFDLGIRGADGIAGPLTRAARAEFIQMSRPLFTPGTSLSAMLEEAAAQARLDSAAYSTADRVITPADAFAIRHASKIVPEAAYGYMMELVSAESGFVTDIEASTSTATGLFQFIENTWMLMLRDHGAKYGLADLAAKIETQQDRNGNDTAFIGNPFLHQYALSLRTDPRISALMGAEFVRENYLNLQAALPARDITRTDQYLAHFLGSGNAVTFISRMERNGRQAAAARFPEAAAANRAVFYRRGAPRSYREIYGFFSRKFDTDTFERAPLAHVPVPQPRPRRPQEPG